MSNKKEVILFSCCDQVNFPYAVNFFRSLTKFHDPAKIDMFLYTSETRKEELSKLPEGIKTVDLTPMLKDDSQFWYRQKPLLMEPLINDYECVVGFDCDSIVFGDLSYIWNTKDYDVATVMNYNRIDPQIYGFVQAQGILPVEYFNCGLVAVRSPKFIHHWKVLCFTEQFNRLQYREQDLLNILCYYGNYNIRCLDHGDPIGGNTGWWGLIAKGELLKAKVLPDKVVIPQSPDNFPKKDTELKIIHIAGGNTPNKMNYRTWTNPDLAERIDYLVK